MKLINDTVYSKGVPIIDFGYTDPRTEQPYSSKQDAILYLNSALAIIPQGFTVCVAEGNSLKEYWKVGENWVKKGSGISILEVQLEIQNSIPEVVIPSYTLQNIYIRTQSVPATPVGDILNDINNPGWQSTLMEHLTGYKRYVSSRSYCSNVPENTSAWSTPIEIINNQSIIESIPETNVYPFTIYTVTQPTQPGQQEVPPIKPNFTIDSNNTIFGQGNTSGESNNTIWYLDCPNASQGTVWVSTNTFIKTYGLPTSATGWTIPRKFIDIDGIILQVESNAESVIERQLSDAVDELLSTLLLSTQELALLRDIEQHAQNGDFAVSSDVDEIKGQISQYGWSVSTDENTQQTSVTYVLQMLDVITGEITTQALESSGDGSLNAALLNIAAGKILSDVWSYFEGGNSNGLSAQSIKKTTITLTPEQIVLKAISGQSQGVNVDDNDVKTSILDLIAGKLTLSATSGGNGVVLTLNGVDGNTYLHTHQFDIDGDIIAKAIISKELNINNKTYINSDGSLLLAAGESGQSYIGTGGSGYLAGGAVTWGQNYIFVYKNSNKTQPLITIKKGDKIQIYHTDNSNTLVLAEIVVLDSNFGNLTTNNILPNANLGDDNTYVGVKFELNNATHVQYLSYNNTSNRLYASTEYNQLYYIKYSGNVLSVKGIIEASGGIIGNWYIGPSGLSAAAIFNNVSQTLALNAGGDIYSYPTLNSSSFNWKLGTDGSAQFSQGSVYFGKDTWFIGTPGTGNELSLISYSNGQITIGSNVNIAGGLTASKINISKVIDNVTVGDYAGIDGPTQNSNKVIWSGGSRESGNPTFYVTDEGEIFGTQGTLSVINNNHITDYSQSLSFNNLKGFERIDNGNYYAINPAKLGNVVYLPDYAHDENNEIYLIMPYAEWVGASDTGYLDCSVSDLDDLRASIGKTIVFVCPNNTRSNTYYVGNALFSKTFMYVQFKPKEVTGTNVLDYYNNDVGNVTNDGNVVVPVVEELMGGSFNNFDSEFRSYNRNGNNIEKVRRIENALLDISTITGNSRHSLGTTSSEVPNTLTFSITIGLSAKNGHEYIYTVILKNDQCRSIDRNAPREPVE